jgi:hypothetical protein
MKITNTFIQNATRYDADFLLIEEGYCQVDTEQDFSGYGNWIHLDKMKAVTFAEGDLSQIEFEDKAEVKQWLENIGGLKHVDCGICNREHNIERAESLGISKLVA